MAQTHLVLVYVLSLVLTYLLGTQGTPCILTMGYVFLLMPTWPRDRKSPMLRAKKQSHEPAEIWCPKSVLKKVSTQRWRNSEFQGVVFLVFSGRLCIVTSASMVSRKPQDTSIYAVSSEPNSLKLPPRNGWIKIFPPWCLLTILSFPPAPTVGKCKGVYVDPLPANCSAKGIPRIAKDPKDKSADWLTILLWLVVEPTPFEKILVKMGIFPK